MSGRLSRRTNGAGHEGDNLSGGGLFPVHGKAYDGAGEVVNYDNEPPAEGPHLSQTEWRPRHPESCCWDSRHIDMPNVIGVSCCDDSVFLFAYDGFGIGLMMTWLFFKDTANGRSAKMQSCSGQYLSYPDLTHGWAQRFEPLDNMTNIVRILVHGLGELEQPILGIGCSLHPAGYGFGLQHESPGGFCQIPGAGGLEFQDGHSLLGYVLGPLSRGESGHAGIFDSEFFLKQSHFVIDEVEFSSETNPFDAAVDSEAPGEGDSTMGQGKRCGGLLL